MADVGSENMLIFKLMSMFLNLYPDAVNIGDVDKYSREFGFSKEFAFAQLLATELGLDLVDSPADKTLFKRYFLPMIHMLNVDDFKNDSYYRTIKITDTAEENWQLKNQQLKAGEAFVCNDPIVMPDGRIIPQIGFFCDDFSFPAVLENGREWMTLMPNETITSAEAVDGAFGNVLTFGLGLGYFAFKAAEKPNVSAVTVVEKDPSVIKLFSLHILPLIPFAEKITVINDDAFEFAEREYKTGKYDFVFTDIWHDPSDGCELYLRMKPYELLNPKAKYVYWLEKTLRLYIDGRLK